MIIRKEGRLVSDSGNPYSGPPAGDDSGSDFDEWVAWLDREAAAGRDPVPPERAEAAQGIRVSLGDAAGIDDALLGSIEDALMKLSDAIATAYLSYNERLGALWEALA